MAHSKWHRGRTKEELLAYLEWEAKAIEKAQERLNERLERCVKLTAECEKMFGLVRDDVSNG